MLFRLVSITIMPTATIMVLADILLDILAAIGDAKALPIINPATASQCALLTIAIKVNELISAIKNRVNFTVPNEKRGLRPPAIKVDNTIDPQPPPPTASINPPPRPNKAIFLIFAVVLFRFILMAFDKITTPRIKVYKDTNGFVYWL